MKKIEIEISKLKDFKLPKIKLEQYSTPPSVIKQFLIFIEKDLLDLINEKLEKNEKIKILDCCAGTGFLGFSILLFFYFLDKNLLKNVEIVFIEKDKDAFEVLKENWSYLKQKFEELKNARILFINEDFFKFETKETFDFAVMNPPFGIQGKVKDKRFVEHVLNLAKIIYSFHLANSLDFFKKNFNVLDYFTTNFTLKQQFWFHSKKKRKIEIVILKFKGPPKNERKI
jgi:predicted RNA methylase